MRWLKTSMLLLGLAVSVQHSCDAAEPRHRAAAPAPSQAPIHHWRGTIVAVDPVSHSMSVDIKGTVMKIRVTPEVRLTSKGKFIAWEQLAAGQQVRLSFTERAHGRLELAAVAVTPSSLTLEVAGVHPGRAR